MDIKTLLLFIILIISIPLVQSAFTVYDDMVVEGSANISNLTLAINCADNEILKWSGGVGKCGPDDSAAGASVSKTANEPELYNDSFIIYLNTTVRNETIDDSIDLKVDQTFIEALGFVITTIIETWFADNRTATDAADTAIRQSVLDNSTDLENRKLNITDQRFNETYTAGDDNIMIILPLIQQMKLVFLY